MQEGRVVGIAAGDIRRGGATLWNASVKQIRGRFMFIKHARRFVALVFAVVAISASSAYSARMNAVMVIPARYTIVQFSFDIVTLRGVELVTYEKTGGGMAVLYRWDWMASQWQGITASELEQFSFMKSAPDYVYLVGTDKDLPSSVDAATAGAEKVIRIKTLNLVQVINILNETMNFSQPEWEALAEKHKLKIKDWNYERRRWGRYGPPKSRTVKSRSTHVVTVTAAQELESLEEPVKPVEPVDKTEVESVEGAGGANPFEEMERELDRMSKQKAAKGVELIPEEPPPAPAPLPEEEPDLKVGVEQNSLPPDNDLIVTPPDIEPEDK